MSEKSFIPKYEDTEDYKQQKAKLHIGSFEDVFNNIFGVNDSKPKVKCEVCGKEYKNEGDVLFYFNLPDRNLCIDCFKEDLKHRNLTTAEIEELAQDYIIRKERDSSICGPAYYLPEALTTKQKEIVYTRINQIYDERYQKEEEKIRDKYYSEALQLIGDETNIIDVAAKLMRRMDEKDKENHYSNDPMRMRFN